MQLMKKSKLVKEIVGKAIEKYGFTFGLPKHYIVGVNWGFSREVDSIMQMILILEHRFAKELIIEFRTNAWGKTRSPSSTEDSWYKYYAYESEEDFKATLEKFVKIIENFGLTRLDELSIEDKIAPTLDMSNKIFENHKNLNDSFIEKNGINVANRSKADISEWFRIIEAKLIETKAEPYEKVQDLLIEIAAFLGEQLRVDLGGNWRQAEIEPRVLSVENLNSYQMRGYAPLSAVVEAWKNQSIKREKQAYLYMLDGKLPMTKEQIIEYQSNKHKYFV